MSQLFDKITTIDLYSQMPGAGGLPTPTDTIKCNDTGYKPNITISATMYPSDVIANVNIRIVNFYPSLPLSEYKWVRITSGYQFDTTSTMDGQIKVAYQESPSPDGVTLISMIVGNATDLLNQEVKFNYGPTNTDAIFQDLIGQLSQSGVKWTLTNTFPAIQIDGYNEAGKAIQCLNTLKDYLKFCFLVEGNELVIYNPKDGRTKTDPIEIKYMSTPPQASASGITFCAPWIPRLRPGMIIKIDPQYFKQTFGAAQVKFRPDGLMIVQTIEVGFNTNTAQNQMTVLALNTVEIVQQ